jgi:hypothetical protein
MNNNAGSSYSYALQQLAAESHFEGTSFSDVGQLKKRFRLGTDRIGHQNGLGQFIARQQSITNGVGA